MLSREESDEILQNELNKFPKIFHCTGKYAINFYIITIVCAVLTDIIALIKSFGDPFMMVVYAISILMSVLAIHLVTKFAIPRRGVEIVILCLYVLYPLRTLIICASLGTNPFDRITARSVTLYVYLAWYIATLIINKRAFMKAQVREMHLSYMEREHDREKYNSITRDQVQTSYTSTTNYRGAAFASAGNTDNSNSFGSSGGFGNSDDMDDLNLDDLNQPANTRPGAGFNNYSFDNLKVFRKNCY